MMRGFIERGAFRHAACCARASFFAGSFAVLGLPSTALAAQPVAPTPAPDPSAAPVAQEGDIIITARKRAERLQDVPIAATVFTNQALERLHASQLRDLQYSVPNVLFSGNSDITNPSITVRGINTNTFTPGLSGPITMYVDGVLTGRSSSFGEDLGDIQQMEILRGPQGTLFGRNSTGGAINVVTKQPSQNTEVSAEAGIGNYNLRQVRAALGGPLGDNAEARLSLYLQRRSPFTKNAVGSGFDDVNYYGGRFQLTFRPSDPLSIHLSADYQRDNVNGPASENLFDPWAQALTILGVPTPDGTFNDPRPRHDDRDGDHFQKRTLEGLAGTINYELAPGWMATSITAYRVTDFHYLQDVDFIDSNHLRDVTEAAFGVPLSWSVGEDFASRYKQTTEELRVSSPAQDPVSFVAGLYYLHESATFFGREKFNDTSFLVFLFSGSPANAPGAGGPEADQTIDSIAAFGSADWHISPAATLTVGMRYTREKARATYRQTPDGFDSVFGFNLIPAFGPVDLRRTDSNFSPTASFQYKFTPDIMGYAKVSRGFKAGGFDYSFRTFVDPFFGLTPSQQIDALTFEPEKVTAYEAGLKSQFFNRRLTFDAAIFRSDYRDQQVRDVERFNGVPVSTFVNAGKSRIWGIEADFSARPTDGLTLNGGVGYLESKILTDVPIGAKGQELPRAPRWTVNFGAEQSIPITSRVNAFVRGDISYRSRMTQFVGDDLHLPAVTLLNAGIGVRLPRGIDVTAWVKNITNKREITERQAVTDSIFAILGIPVNSVFESYGAPRTYGLQIGAHF